MKKITTICLALGDLLFLNTNVNAQAFQKGTINIDLGVGYGLYGTSQSSTYETSYTINGTPTTQSSSRDTTDGALSTVIPISFEYGVSNKIGVGIDVVYNNYFINDSDRVNLESVKAFDFGPKISYHPFNSDFYDLSLGLGIGFTSIKWNVTGLNNSQDFGGSGFYLNIDIKNKFWFSKHIGLYTNIGYKGNFYGNIDRDTSSQEAFYESFAGVSDVSIKDEFKWTMHGVNLGIGIAVKF
jgi:hypothetical protein